MLSSLTMSISAGSLTMTGWARAGVTGSASAMAITSGDHGSGLSRRPTTQATSRGFCGRLINHTSVRYTIIRCLAAGQALHRPRKRSLNFPEYPPGRLTIVGGGCFGEPVKHGG